MKIRHTLSATCLAALCAGSLLVALSASATAQTPGRALMVAVETRDVSAVEKLLKTGSEVDAPDAKGVTPLMIACALGDGRLVAMLLAAGANVQAIDLRGRPVIAYAVINDRAGVAESLIAAGVDVNRSYAQGTTALMWAAQSGAYETVQRLLAKGAMRDSRDDGGSSAFDMAVKAQQGDVLALLRDAS